ncbi:tetratricopeptide repeat protein [Helicobacter ailurogastricus]|uniref:tetratricopeptide repeat protein n=1 Tax=Helicobacter ailurogastricus TaxID=1578720 RepID=UPI001F3D3191|nr:sel1 repeat family protein [Helicobacter ailurogastricus]
MKTNSALNALNSATASPQALEQAQNLSKSLEDLEALLSALQESHTDLLQGANSSQNPTQATNADALRPSPNTTAPEVKPLWKYGVNTLQAFKDYMQAKDLGSASAWLELGKMAVEGIVLYPDDNVAMRCFEKAIELGSVQAMVELGKVYMENGDTQITEYGSGEVISGQEVLHALNPLKDDLESEDYLTIFKHCQVFKDRTLTNCQEKAKELFEKAVGLGEGRGYFALGQMFQYKDSDRAKEYYRQAMRLLKPQAEKGDGEAYALLGMIAKEVAGFDNQESMPLFQKAIDLGYADGYSYLADFVYANMMGSRYTAEERDEQRNAYLKQGAKLGSGKCAISLRPSTDNLPYEGLDNLDSFELAVEQSIEFMDRLMECIQIQEFVALHCRHYQVLLTLLENLSWARAINKRIGLGNIERYQPLLELAEGKIYDIARATNRSNARFERSKWANLFYVDNLFNFVHAKFRAFAIPYYDDARSKKVTAEGSVEFHVYGSGNI